MPEIEYSLENPLPVQHHVATDGHLNGLASSASAKAASGAAGDDSAIPTDGASEGPYQAALNMAEELIARPLRGGGAGTGSDPTFQTTHDGVGANQNADGS